ncbi:hypothetical protein [Streptomyces sp. NPDC017941]|uniref:hypothetical protein n=1 Tax=Streptomyces sp. NPDC017941 TaxID=3365018 RepID=UPI00378C3889
MLDVVTTAGRAWAATEAVLERILVIETTPHRPDFETPVVGIVEDWPMPIVSEKNAPGDSSPAESSSPVAPRASQGRRTPCGSLIPGPRRKRPGKS